MRLDVTKDQAKCPLCSDAYTISDFLGTLASSTWDYSIIEKANEINQITTVPSSGTPVRMVTMTAATKTNFVMDYIGTNKINPTAGIAQANPWISYVIDGQTVRYRLTPTPVWGTIDPITRTSIFRWLQSLWALQGNILSQDKQVITGQNANTTNISRSVLRNRMIKNVALLTRGRQVQTLAQCNNPSLYNFGTCYIVGDLTLNLWNTGTPGILNQNYDTLIIKNGNLTILWSGSVITKNLGIIMLNDTLSLSTSAKWNVYIGPDITYMKTIIYADGGIISVQSNGIPYGVDSPQRTKDLSKQLIIEGSLFTKNTIGGAIGGSYKAPGTSWVTRFEALQYDLNFLRRGVLWWDKNNNNTLNAGEDNKDPLIIKYNPKNVTTPLKWFDVLK
jgi:hypothetical protein